jgi:hypothetical protein
MCTLTIVPHEDGFQLGCNRDERLSRPAALPPHVHVAGSLLALFPTDVPGGGTWIGVNERGLVVSLLNRTAPGDRPAVEGLRCSRGVIARHTLGAEDVDHALSRITALPLRAFDPFTAVVVHHRAVGVVTNDGAQYGVSVQRLERPLCFTSSSLGDSRVSAPRLELFERCVARAREPLLMQGAFHAHRWHDRPEVSVDMRREDAATVSRTWVTLGRERATMTYEVLGGTAASTPSVTEIPCTSLPVSSWQPSQPRT